MKILLVIIAISLFFLMVTGSLMALIIGVATLFEPDPEPEEDLVYVIDLYGSVTESPGISMGQISPQLVRRQLDRVEQNENAEAVVLRINSPGGTVGASQEIASVIDDFELPTVVSMADNVTSGGYYISAPADQIVAQPTTMTGSIGVISVVYNLEELYDKLGIEVEVVKSGEHKDMGFEGLDDEERDLLQALSDEMYENFVMDIANYRGMEEEAVYELATGEIMTGSKAKEKNLVDALGGLDKAVQRAGELAGIEDPNEVKLPPERIFEGFIPLLLENPLELITLLVDGQVDGQNTHFNYDENKIYTPEAESEYKKLYEKTREIPPVEFRYQANY